MRTRFLLSVVATFLTVGAARAPLAAQAAATVCKDGTTSATSGRGACSGHGGVDAKATGAAKKAAAKAAKAEKAAAKSAAKTAAKTEAAEQVTCSDGTTSKAGRGACSGHGGVRSNAAAAVPTAPPSAAAPARAKTEAKSTPKSSERAEAKKSPVATRASASRGENDDPKDAIAQCKDGLYSHSPSRRGACSRHGGVSKWLKEP